VDAPSVLKDHEANSLSSSPSSLAVAGQVALDRFYQHECRAAWWFPSVVRLGPASSSQHDPLGLPGRVENAESQHEPETEARGNRRLDERWR